jgi:hypothetical protein
MLRFIFPSDYFNVKKIDEAYAEQADCLKKVGFSTSVISLEKLAAGFAAIHPQAEIGEQLVYRGWMLAPEDYSCLVTTIENSGAIAFIDLDEYLASHYLPNWYPLIQGFTPETHFLTVNDNLEDALTELGWSGFFVKDYVKSLKTSIGSIITNPSEIKIVVAEMQKFRGLIEGGLCIRRVEDLMTETEKRYFVINGRPFAPLIEEEIPSIVLDCAQRIKSKFFSIDVVDSLVKHGSATTACLKGDQQNVCQRIIEIGDGQVSGLVGWTAARFAELWIH